MRIKLLKEFLALKIPKSASLYGYCTNDDLEFRFFEDFVKTSVVIRCNTHGMPFIIDRMLVDDCSFHCSVDIGPARQRWYPSGQLLSQEYIEHSFTHRPHDVGPAYQEWHLNGEIAEVQYFAGGRLHRPCALGPAHQKWSKDGKEIFREYVEYGRIINAYERDTLERNFHIANCKEAP